MWIFFLAKDQKEIPMNNIVFGRPSKIYFSDSCPRGIGGYSASGRAWRYDIGLSMANEKANNALEFLATIIGPWIDIIEGNLPPESCLLSITNSSSACGWLYSSNFDDISHSLHTILARILSRLLAKAYCCLYSQHLAGVLNCISDSLS